MSENKTMTERLAALEIAALAAEQMRVRPESEAPESEAPESEARESEAPESEANRPEVGDYNPHWRDAATAKQWPANVAVWTNVGALWVLVIAALGTIMTTQPDAAAVADVHTHAAPGNGIADTFLDAIRGGPGGPTIEIAMDPTCPWCRQQHAETAALRAAGWTVLYLPYPRAGAASDAGRALAAAWCEGEAAVDALMLSGDVANYAEPCAAGLAWVRDGRADAQARGVDATPTLFIRGSMSAGYRTAAAIGAP